MMGEPNLQGLEAAHWHSSHKLECAQIAVSSQSSYSGLQNGVFLEEMQKAPNKTLWPEFEIITGDECEFDGEVSEADDRANSLALRDRMDETIKSVVDDFEGGDERKSWATFQERIAKAPEQVLRYCRNAGSQLLWPASSGQDIVGMLVPNFYGQHQVVSHLKPTFPNAAIPVVPCA
ncbi:hypothetical protein Ancab_019600 [Ancistrocladus abbreviatus]